MTCKKATYRNYNGVRSVTYLTSEEKDLLESAMKREERWKVGDAYQYDRRGKLIDNYVPGSSNSRETQEDDCEDWAFTMSP